MIPALVFLAAVFYAVRTARGHSLSLGRTARVVVLLAAAVGLAVPAFIGLVASSYYAMESLLQANGAFRQDFLLVTLAVAGVVAAARAWPDRFGDRAFVLLAVAVAVLAKLAYVWAVQAEAVSDFIGMWRVASALADKGLEVTRNSLKAFSWPHFERVLPFLFPVRAAFGPSPEAYSIPNVLLGAATSLLTWRLARRWFGRTAGRVALVLSLVAVETVLIAEIPTHEVPGAFYTLVALTLFQIAWALHAEGRDRAALAAGAAFGLSLLVLDFQRSTGGVMLLATTLLALGIAVVGESPPRDGQTEERKDRRRLWRGVLLALLPLLVFKISDAAVRQAGLRTPPEVREKGGGMGLISATDSGSDGSYLYFWNNYATRYNSPGVSWYRLALVRLASDTHYNPGARVTLYLRKAKTLFPLGTQTYFYLPNATLFGEKMDPLSARILTASLVFTVLFLAALLVALARIWDIPDLPLGSLAPLFFLATFSAILLLLAEVQPRYLYPIWYIGPIYIGALWRRPA